MGCFGECEGPPRRHFSSAPRLLSRTFLSSFLTCFAPSPAGAPLPRLSPVSPPCPSPSALTRPRSAPPPSLRGAPRPPLRMLGARGPARSGAERAGGGGDGTPRPCPRITPAAPSASPRALSGELFPSEAGAGGARGAAGVLPPRRRAVLWAAGGAPRLASARRLACQSGSRGGPGSRSPSPLTG